MTLLYFSTIRLFILCISAISALSTNVASASQSATILVYHHVSDDMPKSTSIGPEMFKQHMQFLQENHVVLSLTSIVNSIKNGKPVPNNAVAITFDDGYQNIAENGHPILKEFGFPYAIFINPSLIGKLSQQMTWDQVRGLQKEGVTFANHTSEHEHLLTGSAEDGWLKRTMQDITDAEARLVKESIESLKYVAYPYGEYNLRLQNELDKQGYIGFGQHSGAVGANSDWQALPRIPAAGIFANLNTLAVKLSSLPMPIIDKKIKNPELTQKDKHPKQVFTLDTSDFSAAQFSCYYQGKRIALNWQENSVSLILEKSLPDGRSRINCTAPSRANKGRFYWYSQPWFVPTNDGRWLD